MENTHNKVPPLPEGGGAAVDGDDDMAMLVLLQRQPVNNTTAHDC